MAKQVSFGMYWQVYGRQTIDLPDDVDTDDMYEIVQHIRSKWDSIPLPDGLYVSGSDELDEESIDIIPDPDMAWVNYGDIHFLTHGGSLVRYAWPKKNRDTSKTLSDEFDVLMLSPLEEDKVFVGIKRICPDDWKDMFPDIQSMFGYMPEDRMDLARVCAEYIGLEESVDTAPKQKGMYSCKDDFIVTREEAAKWLAEQDVPKTIIL